MNLKIRIILDAEENVFRDIEINENQNLLLFHELIKEAFGLAGEEMASFYLSNENWFQGSEIPLENIFDEDGGETMAKIQMKEVMGEAGSRMIYVYDFFNMWTFFCETLEIKKSKESFTAEVVYSYGETPQKAPVKNNMDFFVEEEIASSEDSIFDDEDDFNEFYY